MSSLATKEVLEKELVRFTKRVDFLTNYIKDLSKDKKNFEALDKAYKLDIEKEFKEHLIKQRNSQIEQINKQDQLKANAIKEIPAMLKDCEKVVLHIAKDIENLRKSNKLKGEAKKQRSEAIKNLLGTKEQVETILKAITTKFKEDPNNTGILADFRQLNEIKKIVK